MLRLCRVSLAVMPIRVGVREASNMPLISRVKRATYVRHYPTVLVQPDGSTITARYHEPRSLIRLPLKFEELTPEEQQLVLVKRKPPEVVVIQEEFERRRRLEGGYLNGAAPTKVVHRVGLAGFSDSLDTTRPL